MVVVVPVYLVLGEEITYCLLVSLKEPRELPNLSNLSKLSTEAEPVVQLVDALTAREGGKLYRKLAESNSRSFRYGGLRGVGTTRPSASQSHLMKE